MFSPGRETTENGLNNSLGSTGVLTTNRLEKPGTVFLEQPKLNKMIKEAVNSDFKGVSK